MSGRKRALRVFSLLAIAVATGQGVEHIRDSNRAMASVDTADPAPSTDDGLTGLRGVTMVAATTEPGANSKCGVSITLAAAPSAMIDVDLSAPCARGERVVIRYSDISFTAMTGADGTLEMQLPALEAETLVAAYFEGSAIALGKITVPDAAAHTRLGVEMPYPARFALRAREGDMLYVGGAGAQPPYSRSPIRTLGAVNGSDRIVAQVYTFPSQDLNASDLSVELRITEDTCGQTLPLTAVLSSNGRLSKVEHSVAVPLCGTSGDILVLKNLLRDLRVAARN
jgi:hypothetical protein